jgi:hypothetical protein
LPAKNVPNGHPVAMPVGTKIGQVSHADWQCWSE